MSKASKNEADLVKTTSIRGLEDEHTPNGTDYGIAKKIFTKAKGANLDLLYDTLKASPEVTACIQAVIEDIMSDEWRFIGSDTAVKDAKKFQIASNFYQILTNAILDLLITGNAYILKLSVNEEKIKSIIKTITRSMAKDLHVKFTRKQVFELIEQNSKKPKDLQVLKANTVEINFDETGKVESYVQEVQGKKRVYLPKDIIHLSMMNVGGQPYGFTPLEPLLSDIATLIFAKNYAGRFYENDGIPNWLFKMPEEAPGGRNYVLLKKELNEMRKSTNKMRNMVLTGNVEAEQLNKFNKDMEFSKLIQHFTQLILVGFGVPAHRVNLTIDVKQVGGQVNRAYEGYYKKINFMQRLLENSLNKYLWSLFNVDIKFKKTYKIDEMREAQIVQILTQSGAITLEEAREMMGLDPEKPEGTDMRSLGDQTAINFGRDRAQEQGREPNQDNTDNKLKNITKNMSDALEVSYYDFVKIVEHKIGEGNFSKANVLYLETESEFILFFSDDMWKYKTRVSKEGLDIETFRVEKIQFFVKLRV